MTVREANTCHVAGVLSNGGNCSHLISSATSHLSFNEFLDLLEAQPERTCVPVPGFSVCADDQTQGIPVKLPARGAAVVMPDEDWGGMKTELETACRELGPRCSYGLKAIIARMK